MGKMIVMNVLVDMMAELNFQMDMTVEWDFQMSVMNVMALVLYCLFSGSSEDSG